MVLRVVRPQGEGLPALGDPFLDAVRITQGNAKIGMSLRQPRIERDRLPVAFDRSIEIALRLPSVGEAEMPLRIVGLGDDGLPVGVNRAVDIAFAPERVSPISSRRAPRSRPK